MNALTQTNVELTSLDIAELTGKKHQHVMRDIRNEIEVLGEEIGQSIFGQSSYFNSQNKEMPCYKFKKDGAMQLALKYDASTRYKVIKHIEEMEQALVKQQDPITLALQAALDTRAQVQTIQADVDALKNTMRIDGAEQLRLYDLGKNKVIKALGGYKSPAYNELSRKTFHKLWKDFKQYFSLPRYSELPKAQLEQGIQFISIWEPDAALKMEIIAVQRQISFEQSET